MNILLNAVFFQLLWFACIFGGDDWALAAVVVYFVVHHYVLVRQSNEWWLILLFVGLGVLVDGALILDGWLVMPPSICAFPIPSPWSSVRKLPVQKQLANSRTEPQLPQLRDAKCPYSH